MRRYLSDEIKLKNINYFVKYFMNSLSITRLQNEYKDIMKKKASGELPINIRIAPLINDCSVDFFEWTLIIEGREKTLWEGGVYEFSLSYHKKKGIFVAPKLKAITPSFKHIHTYEDKKICLGMVFDGIYAPEITIYQIGLELESLIHREPNITSPANHKLCELYSRNTAEYEKEIRLVAIACSR